MVKVKGFFGWRPGYGFLRSDGFSMAFVLRQTRQTTTLAMAAFAALAFAGALETSPAAAWNADLFRVDIPGTCECPLLLLPSTSRPKFQLKPKGHLDFIYVYIRGNHNVKGAPLKESIRTFFFDWRWNFTKHYHSKNMLRGTFDCHVRVTQLAKLGDLRLTSLKSQEVDSQSDFSETHTPKPGMKPTMGIWKMWMRRWVPT